MKKRLFSLLLALTMVLSAMPQIAFAANGEASVDGNLLKLTTVADFEAGQLDGLEILEDVGNGAVTLADGETEGTYLSPVYSTDAFGWMVASWNASIYDGGEVEIWARACQGEDWSDWMSWGPYSPFISRGSEANKGGALAGFTDVDIFEMDDGTADGVQIMAEVRRDDADVESPVLRQVTMTFDGGEMAATYAEEALDELPVSVLNPAPAYSQSIRHPSIGGSICSPVTMTVMMNSRVPELDLLPEELALNIQDEGEGVFGNWSFTVSGAGLYGFESYFQYTDLEILLQELAQGRPVGLGVSYTADPDDDDYPYLDGAYSDTSGHLLTLIGYEYEGGGETLDINSKDFDPEQLYFYSSNSWAPSDATAFHRYQWPQLSEAWSRRSTYIIPSLEREAGAVEGGVVRIDAALEPSTVDRTAFYLVDEDGDPLDMTRFTSGGGVLGYTVEGVYTDMENDLADAVAGKDYGVDYPNPIQVTANNTFFYDISVNDDGSVKLDTNAILEEYGVSFGDSLGITVYAFGDRGYLYIAELDVSIIPDEVIVTPTTEAAGSNVESLIYGDLVEAAVTANDVADDEITLGLLVPEDAIPADAEVTVDGEALNAVDTYEDDNGLLYLEVPVSADAVSATIQVDWGIQTVTYAIDLAGVTKDGDVIVVEGNLVSVDLESGRASGQLELQADGALALAEGETYAEYYSPVYDGFNWEYGMPTVSAYTPGASSVDVQLRAFTERQNEWSDWFSLGRTGTGAASASTSKQGPDVNVDPDVFVLRGSSSTANALRWQMRLVFRGDGDEQPAVYAAYMSYKKSAYDPDEAGVIDTSSLPESGGLDIEAYSAYAYASGMSAWRFENLELILMNGLGSDLLFEEVALAGYDYNTGWGNWAMTNYKPGLFGHVSYSQYGASSALIQQALADGNLVGLYVHGGMVPSTNSSNTSQTIVHSYYTAENGTVMFNLICPRGDVSELNAGKVYGEISAAELDEAIAAYYSSSVRGLMYVVEPQSFDSSWQRVEAEAVMVDEDNDAFALYVDGEQLELDSDFTDDYIDFGNGGVVAYVVSGEAVEGKLAASNFRYGVSVNRDGTFTVPATLKAEMEAYGWADIYVIRNDGVTYTATLEHYHTWDEGVVTEEPTTSRTGVMTYTCTGCGETYTETIDKLPAPVSPVGGSGGSGSSGGSSTADVKEAEAQIKAIPVAANVTLADRAAIEAARAAYEALSTAEKAKVDNSTYEALVAAEAALAVLLAQAPFTDVSETEWYYDAVKYAFDEGMLEGIVTGDSFNGDAVAPRAMIVSMMYNLEGKPAVTPSTFQDLEPGAYYVDAVAWAYANGVTTGKVEGVTFGPLDSITREQMATFLFRYAQYKGMNVVTLEENLTGYPDAGQVSEYAVQAMNWAVGQGIIQGTTSPQGVILDPQGTITRAQTATMLMRFSQLFPAD